MVRAPLVFVVGALALGAVACGHDIGDSCKTSVDCSQGGERLCDITQPDGYCTIFNCEPNTCPSEAACIVFDPQLSAVNVCTGTNGLSRFARSFCLYRCSSNDDCRSGYECQDFSPGDAHQPNDWNALAVDTDRSRKVCVVSRSIQAVKRDTTLPEDNVCSGNSSGGSPASASGGSSGGGAANGGESNGGANGGAAAGASGADSEAGSGGGG